MDKSLTEERSGT
ncbi:hypothetical protein VCHENC02_0111A, partial [Vibrio harveyi]